MAVGGTPKKEKIFSQKNNAHPVPPPPWNPSKGGEKEKREKKRKILGYVRPNSSQGNEKSFGEKFLFKRKKNSPG